ncbi:MAG: imidazole glycerol phosphate synthase subunit HisH [Gemmatimonadaceae bacterium]
MITVIDYGVGNLLSIRNMLHRLGVASRISGDPADVMASAKIILPGIGAFGHGMTRLKSLGLDEALNRRVLDDGVPILGICLGMQLFSRRSEEGEVDGLGWLPADSVVFDNTRLRPRDRVPHMGWSEVAVRGNSRLLSPGDEQSRFYFVHSYHLVFDNPGEVTGWSTHGYSFASMVESGNIAGVQFHPEKSHRYGMAVLRNFAERY